MTFRKEDPAAVPAQLAAETALPTTAVVEDAPPLRPPGPLWRRSLAALGRMPSFSLGLAVVTFFLLGAIFAALVSPYDPEVPDYSVVLQGPSWHHLFGTDDLGRDMLSRVIYGARYTLGISGTAVGLATLMGIPVGLTAGYFGGLLDALVGRVADALFAFPAILMAIAIAATMGPSVQSGVVALTLIAIPEFTRMARGAMLAEREGGYVEVSRAVGSSWVFIIFRSILPNALGPLLVLISLGFANAILNQTALTFLGLGAQPPIPEWGAMLGVARNHLIDAPYFAFFPGVAVCVLVFAFNLVGDGLRDLVDPRQRHRR
jgi:peptide/nickel transport system permease protein